MIQVTIDGKKTEVAPGTTVLAAARSLGIDIPALCDSELVEPYGACRACSVEINDGRKSRIVTACNYPLNKDGIEVFTRSLGGSTKRRSSARNSPPFVWRRS